MIYIVAIIGVLMALVGLAGVLTPGLIIERVRGITVSRQLREFAILVRFVVGAFLMFAAFETAFPLTLLIIGGLIVLAGIALIFVDESQLQAFIEWALGRSDLEVRAGFGVGFLFGAFLVYAVSIQ